MDNLLKLISHEDLDVRRQSITVITSLFPNGKNLNTLGKHFELNME